MRALWGLLLFGWAGCRAHGSSAGGTRTSNVSGDATSSVSEDATGNVSGDAATDAEAAATDAEAPATDAEAVAADAGAAAERAEAVGPVALGRGGTLAAGCVVWSEGRQRVGCVLGTSAPTARWVFATLGVRGREETVLGAASVDENGVRVALPTEARAALEGTLREGGYEALDATATLVPGAQMSVGGVTLRWTRRRRSAHGDGPGMTAEAVELRCRDFGAWRPVFARGARPTTAAVLRAHAIPGDRYVVIDGVFREGVAVEAVARVAMCTR